MTKLTTTLALALCAASPAWAMENMGHHAMAMDHVKGINNASTQAFMAANNTMHQGMDITYTGDVDIDFLRGMIAHHQGAVDMAQVVLKHGGKDHRVNRIAREIIRAQELEIGWMQKWLAQLEAKQQGFQDAAWEGDHLNNY